MKIYLINPDYMLYANPPLGLAYLAVYIKKILPGVEIKILDQIPPERIIQIIKKDKPDIVGLTSVSENWIQVKKFARKIRINSKNAKLIIGGIHITTQPSCFKETIFDYGVLGEGEIPFLKLVQQIMNKKDDSKSLSKVRGLLIRSDTEIINTGLPDHIENLDDIPPIDLSRINMKYYLLPSVSSGFKKTFMILTSRGCPYNCKFCSSSCFWKSKIRFFSAQRVVKEIEEIYIFHEQFTNIVDGTIKLPIVKNNQLFSEDAHS